MVPSINCERLQHIAMTGSAKDVENLLRAYGDSGTNDYRYSCLDWITAGVNSDNNDSRRADKKHSITDYMAHQGVFAEKQAIAPDVVAEFRQAIAQLTARVAELENPHIVKLDKPSPPRPQQ
ncbi:MAG: hypothetical protein HY052_02420 [Proteobacteria bacterium]|nr:hypothetical protein [Pseudomonadota bacterium]